MQGRFEFEPRDLWIGVYWTLAPNHWHVYVCFVPCLPFHIWGWRE